MLKNSLLILILFFLTGCSGVVRKTKEKKEGKQSIEIELDNWDIQGMEKKLNSNDFKSTKHRRKYYEKKIAEMKLANQKLESLKDQIKEIVECGEPKKLRKVVKDTMINSYKLDELENLDFKGTKVFYGKGKHYKKKYKVLMLVALEETTFYLEVEFVFDSGGWHISRFNERR